MKSNKSGKYGLRILFQTFLSSFSSFLLSHFKDLEPEMEREKERGKKKENGKKLSSFPTPFETDAKPDIISFDGYRLKMNECSFSTHFLCPLFSFPLFSLPFSRSLLAQSSRVRNIPFPFTLPSVLS